MLSSIDTSELKFISQMVLNATFFLFKQCDLAFDHLILLCKHVTERFSIRFAKLRACIIFCHFICLICLQCS